MYKQLFLILFCLIHNCIKADYDAINLPRLISISTLIIQGTIEKIDSQNITVKIQSKFKGEYNDSIITISKFSDWECAERFDKYSIDQKEIFFLTFSNKKHHIIGAGNEGEIPIVNNKVYYKHLYLKIDKNPITYKVYNGTISGYEYSLVEFENAIKYYVLNDKNINECVKKNKDYKLDNLKNSVINRIIDELYDLYYID